MKSTTYEPGILLNIVLTVSCCHELDTENKAMGLNLHLLRLIIVLTEETL